MEKESNPVQRKLTTENLKKAGNSDVTVIIPTLNEEENIAEVLQELNQMGYDNIWVVDGNSNDRTVEIVKEFGVNVIPQKGNGKGAALRQAFNHNGIDGDVVVMMDADGSMDPGEVPMFVSAIKSGAEVAKGSRFLPKGQSEDMSAIRRVGNKLLVGILNFLFLTSYTDLCYGYIVFRRDALRRISSSLTSQNFEIETEVCIKAKKLGIKIVEVPSFEHARRHGESNLNTFKDGFRILVFMVRESLLAAR